MKIALCLMKKIGGHMTTSTTKEMKVLTALQEGRTLSSAQIKSYFGAGNHKQ